MYVDKQCLLMNGQDLSQSSGSYYSEFAYNFGSTVGDPGSGNPLYVVICVDEGFTSGGAATVQFCVINESDNTLDGDSTILIETDDIGYASLTRGKIIVIPLPAGLITKQYLGLRVDIGTTTTTAGTATAFVALQPPLNP